MILAFAASILGAAVLAALSFAERRSRRRA